MTMNISEAEFETIVLRSEQPVMVDFGASWCGPCLAMAPLLEVASRELSGRMKIVKIDVDESPAIAARYGVRNMPTMIVFKNGEPQDIKVGAGQPRSQFIKWLEGHVS